MQIKTNAKDLETDIQDLVNLFELDIDLCHEESSSCDIAVNTFTLNGEVFGYTNELPQNLTPLKLKSLRKKFVKNNLYDLLSTKFNKKLVWGSLTGIRPTKLARDLVNEGIVKDYLVSEYLQKEYRVSQQKALLVSKILRNQKGIIRNDNLVDLYINIPICPSRCAYCSFISSELKRVENIVDDYLDALIKELNAVKKIIANKAYIVRNIYIGGGTPTVLTKAQLERIMAELNFQVSELTVECGRPDTITKEKLDILKKYGTTRISINPQTFNDATLKRIGRNHKTVDVLNSYALAIEYGFDVNMDIILGLPGENKGIFTKTINTLLEFAPENVTIHTLSLKNGSFLKEQGAKMNEMDYKKALQEAEDKLMNFGYKPYYLYRQKNQLEGLENVGFYREKPCMFNIDSMEETSTIIAIGANAASKRIFNLENRIERSFNHKFIEDYIKDIDQMILRKIEFFK